MKVTDFRLNEKSNPQVKVDDKWYNLIEFNNCPQGKYGIKKSGIKKPFNPYFFFNSEETEKIDTYFNK